MAALLKGLATHVSRESAEWTEPVGGCTLWLTVKGARRQDEGALLQRAGGAGVAVTPGSLFFPTPPVGLHVRLSISRARLHEIDDGCRRLARAIEELRRRSRSPGGMLSASPEESL